MADTEHASVETYGYKTLPASTSFRVAEVLPSRNGDSIHCHLHLVEWADKPQYEAISYAWGDAEFTAPIFCNDRPINVTKSLHSAVTHLRRMDRSRTLWADALCIDQRDIFERGLQVKQMKRIYESAQKVQVWLGANNDEPHAEIAVQSIDTISNFWCETLGIDTLGNTIGDDTYQEFLLKHRDKLALPNEPGFSSPIMWEVLVWFYSHRYFTRVWAIQEISANTNRDINMGHSKTTWNRIDLVASYIIMEPAFADAHGFFGANCWFVVTIAELVMQPERWLNILYLASNYGCLDPRDVIYGLRGIMNLGAGFNLLAPDYNKSTEEVYRDAVEAALTHLKSTDILLHSTCNELPTWVPRWNVPMLFRNPFRFGKPMPWRPACDTKAIWSMDKDSNILSLSGYVVGIVEFSGNYNQLWFANSTFDSDAERKKLREFWTKILNTLERSQHGEPLDQSLLTSAAVSLSFGCNHSTDPSEQHRLLLHFVAYLAPILADERSPITRYIPSDLLEESKFFDGRVFGKPVWDFQYPDASIFVTASKLVGCAIAPTRAGDAIFVPCGSTYPLALRPQLAGDGLTQYAIRGFSYVDGVMNGELGDIAMSDLQIR